MRAILTPTFTMRRSRRWRTWTAGNVPAVTLRWEMTALRNPGALAVAARVRGVRQTDRSGRAGRLGNAGRRGAVPRLPARQAASGQRFGRGGEDARPFCRCNPRDVAGPADGLEDVGRAARRVEPLPGEPFGKKPRLHDFLGSLAKTTSQVGKDVPARHNPNGDNRYSHPCRRGNGERWVHDVKPAAQARVPSH